MIIILLLTFIKYLEHGSPLKNEAYETTDYTPQLDSPLTPARKTLRRHLRKLFLDLKITHLIGVLYSIVGGTSASDTLLLANGYNKTLT